MSAAADNTVNLPEGTSVSQSVEMFQPAAVSVSVSSFNSGLSYVGGVTVKLLDAGGNPAVDLSGATVAPQTSNIYSSLSFDNLQPGDYTLSFDAGTTGFDAGNTNDSQWTQPVDLQPATTTSVSATVYNLITNSAVMSPL